MPRQAERTEEIGEQLVRLLQKRCEEPSIGGAVLAQAAGGVVERAFEDYRRLVVERVGDRGAWANPAQAVRLEVEGAEEGREDAHRVAAGADVVHEAGEGERGAARAAADLLLALEDEHGGAAAGQLHR